MFKIKLTFCSGNTIELTRVDCSIGGGAPLSCVRGKTAGAYQGVGTFQWSSAVRAVACVFLQAKLTDGRTRVEPLLMGESKSLAASLDYALTKQPIWIQDMFGVSISGRAQVRSLFRVTNSNRKRVGPVSISLNSNICSQDCVEILLDGNPVESPAVLRNMLDSIQDCELAARSCQGGERLGNKGPGVSCFTAIGVRATDCVGEFK